MAIIIPMPYTTDLSQPLRKTLLPGYLQYGDELCHRFQITVKQGGAACDLSGALITCYVIRADGTTAVCEGKASAGVATVDLPDACYRVPGRFNMVIRATKGSVKTTIFWAEGAVMPTTTEDLVDPEDIIPTLDDLLQQIDRMEAATADAIDATKDARAATAETIAVRKQAADALADANEAIAMTDAWVNASATATGLAAGASPTVSVSDGETGKILHFGIPKGDKGDPGEGGVPGLAGPAGPVGATPNLTIGSVEMGDEAFADISGTPENPYLHLVLPRVSLDDLNTYVRFVHNFSEDLKTNVFGIPTSVWVTAYSSDADFPETKTYFFTVGVNVYGKVGGGLTVGFLLDDEEYSKTARNSCPLPDTGDLMTASFTFPVTVRQGSHSIAIRCFATDECQYLGCSFAIYDITLR